MKTIVGVDLSYREAGVCRLRYSRPTPTTSEIKFEKIAKFKTHPCPAKGIDRVTDEVNQIQRFLIEFRSFIAGADEVVVEMPLGSQDALSARYLGYCYSIVAAVELNSDADFIYITPFDLKAWSGAKKNSKDDVRAKVVERLGALLRTRNNNEIDAIGIALLRCDQLSYEAAIQNGHIKAKQKDVRSRTRNAGNIQETFKFLPSD